MTMPPLLLGATLLLWGWQVGLPWLGAIAAALIEAARLVEWRGTLAEPDLRRVARLCHLLLAGLLGYATILQLRNGDVAFSLLSLSSYAPVVLLPLLAVQAWSTDARIDTRQLHWRRPAPGGAPRLFDFSWPAWALSLLAASTLPGSSQNPWFYACFAALLAWGLFPRGTHKTRQLRWALLMLGMVGLGLAAHTGLNRLQGELEANFGEWFMGMESGADSDPSRSQTAIGRIGNLKLSEKIVLRVRSQAPLATPLLLRDASYTTYVESSWLAREQDFKALTPDGDGNWSLHATTRPAAQLQIAYSLKGGKGLLVLPAGSLRISKLPAGQLEMSRLGTVTVKDAPPRVNYEVSYAATATQTDVPPTKLDLAVPRQFAPLFSNLAAELQLHGKPAREVSTVIQHYFQDQFRYSLIQTAPDAGSTPLAHFLLHSRAGHCEYFATATVLLLRSAGIPARYATGYSLQEYSPREQAYVARARHAHAWAQVFIDGAWHELDSTPARWAELEEAQAPGLQWLADIGNWLLFRLMAWRDAADLAAVGPYLLWLPLPVLLYLAARLIRAWRKRPPAPLARSSDSLQPQGLDSEWYPFEQALAEAGLARHPWETPQSWLTRIRSALPAPEMAERLAEVIRLHTRYRFDPVGLSATERAVLKNQLNALMQTLAEARSGPS